MPDVQNAVAHGTLWKSLELETSKEELESLNEELTTVNAQLQSKLSELSQVNDDMQNLLNSTDIATIFLDTDLNIRRYTAEATRLVTLRPTDVGRPIFELASNLQYEDLAAEWPMGHPGITEAVGGRPAGKRSIA
jgi:two-component system, chemotaxis family, CheB/CheR fusion protein